MASGPGVSQGTFNLPNILEELSTVRDKTYQIGVQLGLPPHEIRQFQRKDDDPLARIIERWLGGNVPNGPPLCWQSLVNVLRTDHVGEIGRAHMIEKSYKGEVTLETKIPANSAGVSKATTSDEPMALGSGNSVPSTEGKAEDNPVCDISEASKPDEQRIGGEKLEKIKKICKEVEIILQTADDIDYKAAVTFLDPPDDNFPKPLVYKHGSVLGMIAEKKTALVNTKAGLSVLEKAMKTFPKAKCVLSVGGMGYGFERERCKPADVLVSNKICDCYNWKSGDFESSCPTTDVAQNLKEVFCNVIDCDPFKVSENGRTSKIHCGTVCSFPDSHGMRDKVQSNAPRYAIGGESEAAGLLQFLKREDIVKRKIGVIVIKGVSNCDDGKDWQYTAAMAALHYAKEKLGVPSYSTSEEEEEEMEAEEGGEKLAQSPVPQGEKMTDGPPHSEVIKSLRSLSNSDLNTLGTELGLSYSRVRNMEGDKLNDMVAAWLGGQDNVKSPPTWKHLVDALRSFGHNGVAKSIETRQKL